MALVHELSWSASRARMFHDCKRRYYIQYYLAWKGWEGKASEGRQRAYMLKKMTRLPMLAGEALHQALANWFQARQSGREFTREELEKSALAILRQGYRHSRDGAWRRSAKLVHLAEHHYEEESMSETSGAAAAYGKRYVERIQAGVATFFESADLEEVRAVEPANYLAFEAMDTFILFDTKVYAVPDLAYRRGEEVVIYDWKTGRPRAADAEQLAVYTIYARQKWGVGAEQVETIDAYLPTDEVVTSRHTTEELAPVEERIEASMAEMRAMHFDADASEGDPQAFPMVDAASGECRSCNFRELCDR
jgi:CRISPR/Cas system-associated exonuclease Cas4 (RecB family)